MPHYTSMNMAPAAAAASSSEHTVGCQMEN
jgi:hypothetical protein